MNRIISAGIITEIKFKGKREKKMSKKNRNYKYSGAIFLIMVSMLSLKVLEKDIDRSLLLR